MTMKKVLAIVIAVAVISACAGYFIWDSRSYVATVGNHRIDNHEYVFFLRAQKITTETEAGISNEMERNALWDTPVEGEDPKIIVMNQALENAKELKVQLIKAEQEKFKLSDENKKELLASLNVSLANREKADYVRNTLGLTLDQFRDMMLKSELVNQFAYDFMQKNSDAVPVTEAELKAYYSDYKDDIDEVTVSHLFISTEQEDLTEEEKQQKKLLAEDLFMRVQQGDYMASLISEYSEDRYTKDNGGTYSFTYSEADQQDYTLEFADWAFSVPVGSVEMIVSDYGYHIVKLEGKKSFEDKKEWIKNEIKSQKLNDYYYEKVQEWSRDPAFNLTKNEKVLQRITRKCFSDN